ncbi:MAG: ABC transporter ATP-binding protein [Kineosporiaceae bacterium]
MSAPPAIGLSGVTVRYRGAARPALDAVDLAVRPGEVVAVCGHNGAGKTTLLDVVTGLLGPDSGSVRVIGADPRRLGPHGRARVGVAPADTGLPPAARGGRLLRHVASLHRRPADLDDLVRRLDLRGLLRRQVRRMSTGQRQRLAVACALVGRPDVLVLDEPTASLDPGGRRVVVDLLREAGGKGTAVLWTSHTLQDVARGSDRVVVLHGGRVLADAPPGALTGAVDVVRFDAAPAADVASLRQALPDRIAASEAAPGLFEVVGEGVDAAVLATVATWQASHGGSGRLSVAPRELEDVLLGLTGDHPVDDPVDRPPGGAADGSVDGPAGQRTVAGRR